MRQVDSIPYPSNNLSTKHKYGKLIFALRRCADFIEDGTMKPSDLISTILEFVVEVEDEKL